MLSNPKEIRNTVLVTPEKSERLRTCDQESTPLGNFPRTPMPERLALPIAMVCVVHPG